MKKTAFSAIAALALAAFITTSSSNAEASSGTYVVKPGDTLWKIASDNNVSVNQLKELNKLNADNIFVNQTLYTTSKAGSLNKPISEAAPSKQYNNVIQAGKKRNVLVTTVSTLPKDEVEKSFPITGASSKVLGAAVKIALPLQGTPYLWAGSSIEGFDCSGFLSYVYKNAGLNLPRTDTIGLYKISSYVDKPAIGDIVFFENTYRIGISHAGIYLGNGNFIHAGSKQVEIASVNSTYWKDKVMGFKRLNQLK